MLNHCLNFLYHAINLMPIVITSFINFKVADNVLNRFYKICEFRKNFLEESTQQKTFFFTSCPKLLETDVKIEEATAVLAECGRLVGVRWALVPVAVAPCPGPRMGMGKVWPPTRGRTQLRDTITRTTSPPGKGAFCF